MNNFVAIDFETANSKRVSACSIGYAVVEDGIVVKSNQHLIKPVGGHALFQSTIHGITEEHTWNQPHFDELFPAIKPLFNNTIISHSCFDQQVLKALLEYFNIDVSFNFIDSCAIAKEKLPQLKNHKLTTLADFYKLQPFDHHNAKDDAVACALIFLNMLNSSDAKEETITNNEIEFMGFIKGILSDGIVNYKEAYELLYWLEDNFKTDGKHKKIYKAINEALSDDRLSKQEGIEIKNILENFIKEDK